MPKRTDIKKVLVIGSGPIVIGQAAEFDYAGTQACLALKEEGYEVVLCNSNPATIMTDTSIADKVYMEPLTLEYIAKIIRYERPDAILPGIGGQTGLNLAMQLEKKGILKECRVELLGTSSESIERAEDRELFKLHSQIQPRLTADYGKNGIGTLKAYDLCDIFQRQRLHIDLIGNGGIRHNRCGVGVTKDDFVALFLKSKARLRSRVVKLCRLTDNDRTGADHKDLFYIGSLRHCSSPPA